jgi:hypothetical protein
MNVRLKSYLAYLLSISAGLILVGYQGMFTNIAPIKNADQLLVNWSYGFHNIVSNWFFFQPWTQASINVSIGPAAWDTYRALVVVAFLAGSLFTYMAFLAINRFRGPINWRFVCSLVLVGWLALDASWQYQVSQQVVQTRMAFAGETEEEKALAGPDSEVYQLIQAVLPHLGDQSARVFIAATDEYLGLRAAYRLYPHNPFWRRHFGNELPSAAALKPGDFILTLRSHKVVFDPDTGQLAWPLGQQILAAQMLVNPLGSLYQVIKP